MKFSDLILACMPPVLAIIMQMLPFPNKRWLTNNAVGEQTRRRLPASAAVAMREMTSGALAVAGILPAVVGYVTGAFAVFTTVSEHRKDLLNIYLTIIGVATVVAIIVIALLMGRTLFRIATGRLHVPLIGFTMTPAGVIGIICYALNGGLILIAVALYNGWLPEFA